MTTPTLYVPSYDFTDWQTAHPTDPLPADQVDIQFAAISLTTTQIINNLSLIQRSDGELANEIVTIDSLSSDVIEMIGEWTPRGDWVTATAYAKLDLVTNSSLNYVCVTAHTSGTFATDLAAGKWMLIGSGVRSFNGRTGVVTPAANDYAASQVSNDSSVSGANVKLALQTLSAAITAALALIPALPVSIANGGTGQTTAAAAWAALLQAATTAEIALGTDNTKAITAAANLRYTRAAKLAAFRISR